MLPAKRYSPRRAAAADDESKPPLHVDVVWKKNDELQIPYPWGTSSDPRRDEVVEGVRIVYREIPLR